MYLSTMLKRPVALFILTVWPEPKSSAAGKRMMQLVELLAADHDIHLASTAAPAEATQPDLHEIATLHQIRLNSSTFNDLLEEIRPDIVVFDRYMTEEQFSWRVAEVVPEALRVLDTEDLHFIRYAREQVVNSGGGNLFDFIHNDRTYRELAAIWRSDLSLIISEAEIQILGSMCQVPSSILFYLPLFTDSDEPHVTVPFDNRKNLMMIGNGHHAPNNDSVLYFHQHIWPELKQVLPEAEMHIYGAYLPEKILRLHDPRNRFLVKGRADDVHCAVKNYKLLMAPLRFGAGLKGKLFDAMQSGTPSVTSVIGIEGIAEAAEWPGYCYTEKSDLIQKTKELYTDAGVWQGGVNKISAILRMFSKHRFDAVFLSTIHKLRRDLQDVRKQQLISRMLWHQSLRSTEFMSRWIEEKNK